MALNSAKESSRNFDGVGRVLRADGGGIGFLGPGARPDADE
jgi:hypothetical protein